MRTNTQEAVLSAYIASIEKCTPRDAEPSRKQCRHSGRPKAYPKMSRPIEFLAAEFASNCVPNRPALCRIQGLSPDFSTGVSNGVGQDLEKTAFSGTTALMKRSCVRGEAAFFMTECSQSAFPFEAHFSRQVLAEFNGGRMTTPCARIVR